MNKYSRKLKRTMRKKIRIIFIFLYAGVLPWKLITEMTFWGTALFYLSSLLRPCTRGDKQAARADVVSGYSQLSSALQDRSLKPLASTGWDTRHSHLPSSKWTAFCQPPSPSAELPIALRSKKWSWDSFTTGWRTLFVHLQYHFLWVGSSLTDYCLLGFI